MDKKPINVFSEIGKLDTVLVHRPGKELENLTPDTLERLLFDDIPFLQVADQEHDAMTDIMRKNGVEVLYIEKLTAETLDENPDKRDAFIDQFIKEAKIDEKYKDQFRKFLADMNNQDMVNQMIAGTEKLELGLKQDLEEYPFVADPLPNVLFQRDPFASVGNGITMHRMWSETRNRETLFPDFVFKNNSRFKGQVEYFYDRNDTTGSIEGGDVLVLNKDTLIIGVSQRTTMSAVEVVAKNVFEKGQYNRVIVIDLPKARAFMHLDTVFTNADVNKFIAHPLIFDNMDQFKIYEIKKGVEGKKEIKESLIDVLSEAVGQPVEIIRCGGNDPVAAAREQWNDGTNCVALAPGHVIAYSRNHVTIELMKKAGITVEIMPSSELSRGRGGPRCMTMPIVREDVDNTPKN